MTGRSECRRYIRPLLTLGKEDLVQYLSQRNLTWCEDSSNGERKYTRNRIRLDVVPQLEDIAGGKIALQK